MFYDTNELPDHLKLVAGHRLLDTVTLTDERVERRTKRTTRTQGWGATEAGRGIADKYFEAIEASIQATLGGKARVGIPSDFFRLDAPLMTQIVITGILDTAVDELPRVKTVMTIGKQAELEVFTYLMANKDLVAWEAARKAAKEKYSVAERAKVLRTAEWNGRDEWTPWTETQKAEVGNWLINCASTSGLFVETSVTEQDGKKRKVEQRYLELTHEANEVADAIIEKMHEHLTYHLPSLTPPAPWTSSRQLINNAHVALVGTRFWNNDKVIRAEIETGAMAQPLAALNAAQAVAWKVNTFIVDVAEQCFKRGIRVDKKPVKGIPAKSDIEIPRVDWDGLSAREQKAHAVKVDAIKKRNRALKAQRLELTMDLRTARQFAGAPFWTPMRLDYRGRFYSLPRFNYQGRKVVRAMFLFDKGQVLTEDGLKWLRVHVANCGDYEMADGRKVSKLSFEERAQWTVDNHSDLMRYSADPMGTVDEWSQAGEPWLFLAACRALAEAEAGLTVHLPVAWDGSSNGLQHLCLMTRDESGHLVNLMASTEPSDLYSTVADKVRSNIEAEVGKNPLAQVCLDAGINRKLVKRATMTLAYGSSAGGFGEDGKPTGMTKQFMTDFMEPMANEVLEKIRTVHPYGDNPGKAAMYLARQTYKACTTILKRPIEAMKFIQGLAKACADEGKPMVWRTPLGFPVHLRYPEMREVRARLVTHDKGRYEPRIQVADEGTIDGKKTKGASAPGLTHSMDAAHLMATTLACADENIDLALVHDSFASSANDAARLRSVLLERLHWLYSEHDVFQNLKDDVEKHLGHSVHVKVPAKGALDIDQVRVADYAFA